MASKRAERKKLQDVIYRILKNRPNRAELKKTIEMPRSRAAGTIDEWRYSFIQLHYIYPHPADDTFNKRTILKEGRRPGQPISAARRQALSTKAKNQPRGSNGRFIKSKKKKHRMVKKKRKKHRPLRRDETSSDLRYPSRLKNDKERRAWDAENRRNRLANMRRSGQVR